MKFLSVLAEVNMVSLGFLNKIHERVTLGRLRARAYVFTGSYFRLQKHFDYYVKKAFTNHTNQVEEKQQTFYEAAISVLFKAIATNKLVKLPRKHLWQKLPFY